MHKRQTVLWSIQSDLPGKLDTISEFAQYIIEFLFECAKTEIYIYIDVFEVFISKETHSF